MQQQQSNYLLFTVLFLALKSCIAQAERIRPHHAHIATIPTLASAAGRTLRAVHVHTAQHSHCGPLCHAHGTCNEELGRCDCLKGWQGVQCEEVTPAKELDTLCSAMGYTSGRSCVQDARVCLNDCNARGTCMQGVCHCKPGFFGADCALSLEEAVQEACEDGATGASPHAACGLAAKEVAGGRDHRITEPGMRGMYPAKLQARGGGHDPPGHTLSARQRGSGSSCVRSNSSATEGGAMQGLARRPPRRPVLLAGQPYATRQKRPWVYVYELPPQLTTWLNTRRLDRPLHLQFWQRLLSSGARTADGNAADWYFIPVRVRRTGDGPTLEAALRYIQATWPWWNATGGARHFAFHTGDLGVAELEPGPRNASAPLTWLTHWGLSKARPESLWDAAHRPQQDMVVPVHFGPHTLERMGLTTHALHPKAPQPARGTTLFFAGRICGDRQPPATNGTYPNCGPVSAGYSGGVRQAVHHHHHNRSGYVIVPGVKGALAQHAHTARFCLAPPGGGHGQRQVLVSFAGCVPLVIGDNIMQPFEPALKWNSFAAMLPESSIPGLHTVLGVVGEEKLALLQRGLRCAAQHMAWSSLVGGTMGESGQWDAFETTLEVLRMKSQYPRAQPVTYTSIDTDFARFMACGARHMGGELDMDWLANQGPLFRAAFNTAANGPDASWPPHAADTPSTPSTSAAAHAAGTGTGGAGAAAHDTLSTSPNRAWGMAWWDRQARRGGVLVRSTSHADSQAMQAALAAAHAGSSPRRTGTGASSGGAADTAGSGRGQLCSHSRHDTVIPQGGDPALAEPSCFACRKSMRSATHGPPGSFMCCSTPAAELATCRRVWD